MLGKAHLMDYATGKGLIGAVPVVAAGLVCIADGSSDLKSTLPQSELSIFKLSRLSESYPRVIGEFLTSSYLHVEPQSERA